MPTSGSGSATGTVSSGSFTFDVTDDIGKIRMLITDKDEADYTFSDEEIQVFLDLKPENLFSAAALAAETWARTRAHLSAEIRSADGTTSKRRTIAELLALAKSLREAALNGALVTGRLDVSAPNEYLDSYRPEWAGINDLLPVE